MEIFILWDTTNRTVDAYDVVDVKDQATIFDKPKIPGSEILVLLSYDGGKKCDPLQWPRLKTRTVLDVFKRLKRVATAIVQTKVLAWLI